MERLTFEGNFCDIAMCKEIPGGSFCEDGACSQRKVWERLKHYEDLEEQGKLVALPCKVGDEVWVIRNYKGTNVPLCGTVREMVYLEDMRLGIAVKHVGRGFWGVNIFATREEVEAALKGGAGNG